MNSDAITRFLNEVARIPTLTAEEEATLRAQIRVGDEGARHRLVEGSLSLALSMARKKARQIGARHLHELICEANLTVAELGRNFDPDHPHPFGVCAYFALLQRLARVAGPMLQPVRFSRAVFDLRRAERSARREMRQRLEREPTRAELARELQVPTSRLEQASRAFVAPLELDDPDVGLLEGTERSPEQQALCAIDATTAQEAMRDLNPRQRKTLSKRFGLEDGQSGSYAEIAAERGVSRQCIYQECRSALGRLGQAILGADSSAVNDAA